MHIGLCGPGEAVAALEVENVLGYAGRNGGVETVLRAEMPENWVATHLGAEGGHRRGPPGGGV